MNALAYIPPLAAQLRDYAKHIPVVIEPIGDNTIRTRVLSYVRRNPGITSPAVRAMMPDVARKSVQRTISELDSENVVMRSGVRGHYRYSIIGGAQ